MPPTFAQVFRTYTTRLLFWLIGLYVVLVAIGGEILDPTRRLPAEILDKMSPWVKLGMLGITPRFTLVAGVVGLLLGTHLKLQFADPRSRLVPGFASPHLAVAGVIVALMGVVYPVFMAWRIGVDPAGAVGLSLGILALVAWACYATSGLPTTLTFFVWIVLTVPPLAGPILLPLLLGESNAPRAGLIVATLISLALYSRRLIATSEEDVAYHRRLPMNAWDFVSRTARRDRARWSTPDQFPWWLRLSTRSDTQTDRLVEAASRGGSRGAALWRLGSSPQSPIGMGLWVGGTMCVFGFLAASGAVKGAVGGTLAYIIIGQFLFVMPCFMTGGQLMQRWDRLSGELMRPVSRGEMTRKLLAGYALDTAVVWTVVLAASIALLALASPERVTPRTLGEMAALSAASQALGIAVSAWVISYRSMAKYMLVTFVVTITLYALASAWWFARDVAGPVGVAGATLLVAAAAAALLRVAHARWCRVEMG